MMVTVPPGVTEGFPFQINTPSGPMIVTCPPGVKSGMEMQVNVPAVAAVYVVDAVPMGTVVSGEPVVSQTMERDISAGGVTAMIPGYDTADVWAFQRKMRGSYVAALVCVGGV